MSTLRERLEGLVAKWREFGERSIMEEAYTALGEARGCRNCARELAAILAANEQEPLERTFTAQQMLDAFRPWAQLLGKQEAQINQDYSFDKSHGGGVV